MRKKQSKFLLLIFVAGYGFAWHLTSIHPAIGLLSLSLTGLLISIPRIIQNQLSGLVMSLFLVTLAVIFPPCVVCLPLWGLIAFLGGVGMLLENWLPVLMGLILYALFTGRATYCVVVRV